VIDRIRVALITLSGEAIDIILSLLAEVMLSFVFE
jgi:hypothetical protein